MIKIAKILSLLFIVPFLVACYNEEELPTTPQIAFQSIEFKDSPDGADSLILEFSFTDGDANIGLGSEDIFFPYNQFLVYLDENDSIITVSKIDEVNGPVYLAQLVSANITLSANGQDIFYSFSGSNHAVLAFDKQLFDGDLAEVDLECPNIYNQEINGTRVYGSTSQIGLQVYKFADNSSSLTSYTIRLDDDMLVLPVETHYNMLITVEQNINGQYAEVDFRTIFGSTDCSLGNFNGRIPWFDREGKRGTITYSMNSLGWRLALQDIPTRIRFQVLDRDGNFSNEAVTPDFLLSQITQ